MTKSTTELESALQARAEQKLKQELRSIFDKMYAGFRPDEVTVPVNKNDRAGPSIKIDVYETLRAIEKATFEHNIDRYVAKEVEALLSTVDQIVELRDSITMIDERSHDS